MSESRETAEVRIYGETVVALYIHLKQHDSALPYVLRALCDRLERVLYEYLSIEEMEHLDRLYAEGKPLLGSRRSGDSRSSADAET